MIWYRPYDHFNINKCVTVEQYSKVFRKTNGMCYSAKYDRNLLYTRQYCYYRPTADRSIISICGRSRLTGYDTGPVHTKGAGSVCVAVAKQKYGLCLLQRFLGRDPKSINVFAMWQQ